MHQRVPAIGLLWAVLAYPSRVVKITAHVQLTRQSWGWNARVDAEELQAIALIVLKWQKTAQDFARGVIYVMFWCITIKLSRVSDAFFTTTTVNNNELHR